MGNDSHTVPEELWQELLSKKRELWLNVLSGSMAPLAPIGSRVLIRSHPPDQFRFGDIVLFKDGERFITDFHGRLIVIDI